MGRRCGFQDKVGYAGNTVIEYELDEGNPTPSITHCVAILHEACSSVCAFANGK